MYDTPGYAKNHEMLFSEMYTCILIIPGGGGGGGGLDHHDPTSRSTPECEIPL